MKSNKTRERILDASLMLFNEKKASNVSTVQISAELDISPGNLYYYYANKEEVIRCILEERMTKEFDELAERYEKADTAEKLVECLKESLAHCLKYKFFYLEIPTLLTNDSTLMELYDVLLEKIKNVSDRLYGAWVEKGRASGEICEHSEDIAENSISMFMGVAAYCDIAVSKRLNDAEMTARALRLMIAYFMPFFTEKMRTEVAELLSA